MHAPQSGPRARCLCKVLAAERARAQAVRYRSPPRSWISNTPACYAACLPACFPPPCRRAAGKRVQIGLALSSRLSTLRDRYGVNEIETSELKLVRGSSVVRTPYGPCGQIHAALPCWQPCRSSSCNVSEVATLLQAVPLFTAGTERALIQNRASCNAADAAQVKKLGEGAFATVEQCLYTPKSGGKPVMVAVKKLKPEIKANEEDMVSFMSEVSISMWGETSATYQAEAR